MYKRLLGLTLSAVILAYGAVDAIAQDRMTTQPNQQQAQARPMDQGGASPMGQGGMMGRGMMGAGMMSPPPMLLGIMFALIDTDSDGTVSLQEFQAAHERIFKVMDANKDGKLTLEEMQAFMSGTK